MLKPVEANCSSMVAVNKFSSEGYSMTSEKGFFFVRKRVSIVTRSSCRNVLRDIKRTQAASASRAKKSNESNGALALRRHLRRPRRERLLQAYDRASSRRRSREGDKLSRRCAKADRFVRHQVAARARHVRNARRIASAGVGFAPRQQRTPDRSKEWCGTAGMVLFGVVGGVPARLIGLGRPCCRLFERNSLTHPCERRILASMRNSFHRAEEQLCL